MANQSITRGWDAILAMSSEQVNAVLFQDYLRRGPGSVTNRVRALIPADQPSQYYILDVRLGPPLLDFAKGTLAMLLVNGSLAFVDGTQVCWVMPIQHDSQISGSLDLSQVTGKDIVGRIVVDLAKGSFVPTITGVDPQSTVPKQIGDTLDTYFAQHDMNLELGTVVAGNVPPPLTPTAFQFYIQQKPGAAEHCLLLFIKTNGPGGAPPSPLEQYPLSGNNTTALMISAKTIWNGLVPNIANNMVKITPDAGDSPMGATGTGSVPLGIIQSGGPDQWTWDYTYGDDSYKAAPVTIPINGFRIAVNNSVMSMSWSYQWFQTYAHQWTNMNGSRGHNTDGQNVVVSYSRSSPPKVDPVTCVVSFPGEAQAKVDTVHWWDGWVDGMISGPCNQILAGLSQMTLPSVDAFTLTNILFPSGHTVRPAAADFPCDLVLHGSLALPLEVTPRSVTLTPGATQQFAVTGNPDVEWRCQSGGTISATGLYTAPKTSGTRVVIIAAILKSNQSTVGMAMAQVEQRPANTGVTISPGTQMVTAMKSVTLLVTNKAGNPSDATLTLDPAGMGTLTPGFNTGQWTYEYPNKIDSSSTVTVSAKGSDGTGTATINLMPTATVTISPASATVKAGQSVKLTATGDDGLSWLAWPMGSLTVDDTGLIATYTAPASVQGTQHVRVLAYDLESEDSVALAMAVVTVTA
jgi:hypothetical protein